MSKLLERQMDFADAVGLLLRKVKEMGYRCTLGEGYRTPEQAAIYASNGLGIPNSLHCKRLAIDINLFKDGKYLGNSEDYEPLGVWWESIGGSWGGRFKKRPDGNHFSFEWEGVR